MKYKLTKVEEYQGCNVCKDECVFADNCTDEYADKCCKADFEHGLYGGFFFVFKEQTDETN